MITWGGVNMKKVLILSLLIGLITMGVVMAWCSEQDGGDNPFSFGVTNYYDYPTNISKADYCFVPGIGAVNYCMVAKSDCRLKEFYCSATETLVSRMYYAVTYCSNGRAI